MCMLQVTTVDRYQGQQNDFIILSLVRTKHVGHLRDVRRLVVAMSRARLGLYVLARVSLFQSCTELQPAFQLVNTSCFNCILYPISSLIHIHIMNQLHVHVYTVLCEYIHCALDDDKAFAATPDSS